MSVKLVSPHTASVDGWENWSSNGEFWSEDSIPKAPQRDLLADFMVWVAREYASHCRRTHKASRMLPFVFEGARTPPSLDWALLFWFDVCLMDRCLIAERLSQLGGSLADEPWPALWVERDGVTVALERTEVRIEATGREVAAQVIDGWLTSLVVVRKALEVLRARNDNAFVADVLVAVHEQSEPGLRPTREETLARHHSWLRTLASVATNSGLPVTWHAVLRLPSGLKVARRPGEPHWLRFPAVSFFAAIQPVRLG
jgi:hypothetical protein